MALAFTALPPAADAVYHQIVNKQNLWCLESNQAGDVYVNPCQSGNLHQLWERWNGGWTRSVATGLCLAGAGQFSAGSIHTRPCVWDERRLNWLHWYGGWYQRAGFDAAGTSNPPECLSRLSGSDNDVTGVVCQNPNGPNPLGELWYAVEVSMPPSPPPPPPPPPPVDPCEPSSTSSGLRLRVRIRRSRRVATIDYGRRPRVNGRLVTADGAPVTGASVCVGMQRAPRAPVRAAASVVTDARGRFVYTVGEGPSRRVWFVHRTGGASVSASVLLHVRAPVRLRASPRSLRNGESVVLRGHVGGERAGRGLLVELQAERGRRWQTFATSRTRRRGRFRYAYRFTRTVGVQTYGLRARVPVQPGSPFAAGASRRVRVKVIG